MSDTGREPELKGSARIGRCARIGGGLSTEERSKVGMQSLSTLPTALLMHEIRLGTRLR